MSVPCCEPGRCCCVADRPSLFSFPPCLLQIQRKLIAALCLAFVFMIIEVRNTPCLILGLWLVGGRWATLQGQECGIRRCSMIVCTADVACRLRPRALLGRCQASAKPLPSRARQVVGGIYAHSLAIITDAAHLLSDVSGFAVAVSWLGVVGSAPAGRLRHAQTMMHCGAGSLVALHALHPRSASLCVRACVQVLAAVWAKRRSQEHFSYGYHRVEVRRCSRAAWGLAAGLLGAPE